MGTWLRRNILPFAAIAGALGGIGYVQITRNFGEPSAWITVVAAVLTIYGYLAEYRPWPRVPFPLLLVAAFVWMSCAVGKMALHYL